MERLISEAVIDGVVYPIYDIEGDIFIEINNRLYDINDVNKAKADNLEVEVEANDTSVSSTSNDGSYLSGARKKRERKKVDWDKVSSALTNIGKGVGGAIGGVIGGVLGGAIDPLKTETSIEIDEGNMRTNQNQALIQQQQQQQQENERKRKRTTLIIGAGILALVLIVLVVLLSKKNY
ncbi:MAG: hypothetical protein NZM44_00925 [Candidatus Calescibacterium sp.]|nr:hypothetical protein [Candidatus Calescibacterium sp.]